MYDERKNWWTREYSYLVGEHFVDAVMKDDLSKLTDEDKEELAEWKDQLEADHTNLSPDQHYGVAEKKIECYGPYDWGYCCITAQWALVKEIRFTVSYERSEV